MDYCIVSNSRSEQWAGVGGVAGGWERGERGGPVGKRRYEIIAPSSCALV